MALEFALSQHPFRVGLAEGVDPRQAPPGTLLTAENVEWSKSGRLQKRSGVAAVTTAGLGGGDTTVTNRLFARGNELCMVADHRDLYTLASSSATSWHLVGNVPEVGVTTETLIDTLAGISASDVAVSAAGVTVHAWVTGSPFSGSAGSLYVQALHGSTQFVAPVLLNQSTSYGCRVLIIGTTAWVITNVAGTEIRAFPFDLTTGTVDPVTYTALRSDAVNNAFDACVIGSTIVLAYTKTGPAFSLYSYNTSLVQQATAAVTGETLEAEAVSICGASGDFLAVVYSVNNAGTWSAKSAVANPSTLAQTVAPFTLQSGSYVIPYVGCCWFDTAQYIASHSVVRTENQAAVTVLISAAGSIDATTERGTTGKLPTSRPFMLGTRCYMSLVDYPEIVGARQGFAESALVQVEVSDTGSPGDYVPHRMVAKLERGLGGVTGYYTPMPSVAVSGDEAWLLVPYQADPTNNIVYQRNGMRLAHLTVGSELPSDYWRSVTVGQETYIAAGQFAAYDGQHVFDYGFERAPWVSATSTSGAAGSVAAGDYLYAFHGEFRSAAGVRHRSAVGYSAVVTAAGAGSTNTIKVGGCNLGLKQGQGMADAAPLWTMLEAHRTVVGGSVYYRLSADPYANIMLLTVLNDTQDLVDTRADSDMDGSGTDLNTRPLLYTTGGILDDEQPPALTTVLLHKSRLWGIASDRRTIWYSKSFQDDLGTAPGFSTSFRIGFDEELTALASMDEKLIVFGEQSIWYILGEGPAPDGSNSDLTSANGIQTDVGCIDPRSIVSTPDGIMFQSARGLYLLTRGLELVWIGRAVKDQLISYPNVTSAVLVPNKNQVRFSCNNDAGTAHVVLVFDYVEKQWTTFRYLGGTVAIADACVWEGQYTFATTARAIYQESAATYLDAGSWVTLTLETAWLSAAGPLAFQSVRRFALHGESHTNHDLSVWVGFDGAASYAQGPATFLAGSVVTSVGDLEACEVHIGNRRKCSSVRFKIQDATPTTPGTYPVTTGRGPSFGTMGIEVGIKRGFEKKPAAKRG
jgi:hypothetical protein